MGKKRQLREYIGPNDSRCTAMEGANEAPGIPIPLAELIDTLADASQNQRIWLNDFRSEKVTISADLYETILAYQHYRRRSA